MSTSTHIVGCRPPDAKWRQMKTVWDACTAAGVVVPRSVYDFFSGETPDERGLDEPLLDTRVVRFVHSTACEEEFELEIDVSGLSEHITHIRVVRSW